MSDPVGSWPQLLKDACKWIKENIVDPVVDSVEKALAPINSTVSNGMVFGASIGIVGMTVMPCISTDSKGNFALQISGSWGITTNPGFGVTTGFSSLVTNASDTSKLNGKAYVLGGSGFYPVSKGLNVGGGADLNVIPDSELNKTYYGVSIFRGISTSLGSEYHVGPGSTITLFEFNIFSLYDKISSGETGR